MTKDLFRLRSSLVAALLVSLVWLGCTDGNNPLTAPDGLVPDISVVSQDAFGLAIAAQENHTARLLTTQGLIGTAVGLAENGQPVVKLFLATEGVGGLPVSLDGIPVVVEVIGEIFALQQAQGKPDCSPWPACKKGNDGGEEDPPEEPTDPTARFLRPVPIGISTGHPDITAGTIGARVTDGTDVFALSNNHVYANKNAAQIGDAVIQPGTFDGGASPDDDIGTLSAYVTIVFGGVFENVVDAAIALSSTEDLGNATPADGYGAPSSGTASAAVNMRVMKYGRTTGQTKGRVRGINAIVNVNYGAAGIARFVGQIVIGGGGFSAGGDSGSLVVTESGATPVGLLFAGSSRVTIANPIDAVLAELAAAAEVALLTIDGSNN